MNKTESRIVDSLEVRSEGEGLPTIIGYAAKFNSLSEDMGFRERIKPGSFKRAIEEKHDIRALINHDESQVLGRTASGTLTIAEDSIGLYVEISPPDTQAGRDICTSIKRGDVSQMSFQFMVLEEEWSTSEGVTIREISDVRMLDVSVVTFPAYADTECALRSLVTWQAGQLELRTTEQIQEVEAPAEAVELETEQVTEPVDESEKVDEQDDKENKQAAELADILFKNKLAMLKIQLAELL